MASFLAVVDPDPARRTRALELVEAGIAPVDGLRRGRIDARAFGLVWAIGARAPLSQSADERGAAAIFGDALDDEGRALEAATLQRAWRDGERGALAPSGYHAALAWDRDAGLRASADLLGYFPLYWFTAGDVLVVGSSVRLFRHHPEVRLELDPSGLVSLLFLSMLAGDRTLLRGVRRLAAGHRLEWRPGAEPREVREFVIRPTALRHDWPFSAQVEVLGEQLERTMRRHAPGGERVGLFLSGGLDSREIGGYLHRQGSPLVALTWASPGDLELACARPVARALCAEHLVAAPPDGELQEQVELAAGWDNLVSGLNGPWYWGMRPDGERLPARTFTGLTLDGLIGGYSPNPAWDPRARRMGFDVYLPTQNSFGVPEADLRALLAPSGWGHVLDELIAEMRARWERGGVSEGQRALAFHMVHRHRLRLAPHAWPLSFSTWPVFPVLDRELLEMAASLAPTSFLERRLQSALLCEAFPALAELPLDQNSLVTRTLRPRLREQLAVSVLRRVGWPGRRRRGGPDPRRMFRVYDLNGAMWRGARARAEGGRARARELLDGATLERLLPPPGGPAFRYGDMMLDASGPRMLVGLLTWLQQYPV